MKELKDMSLEELWQLFPIILKEHSSDYSFWYSEEKRDLLHTLRNFDVCRINHIGSTAIDGLIAKPIVDILLELPQDYDMSRIATQLQNTCWIQMSRNDEDKTLDLNKGYTPVGFAEKVYHLHVKPSGDWAELYFRDYLKEHSDIAKQYETLKLKLQKLYEHNRDAYTNAKSEFVMKYSTVARSEYPKRYIPAC